jgi:hypothetical protein
VVTSALPAIGVPGHTKRYYIFDGCFLTLYNSILHKETVFANLASLKVTAVFIDDIMTMHRVAGMKQIL